MAITRDASAIIDRAVDIYFAMTDEEREESLKHYGTPRHSGRYPWGSGENPYQRTDMFGSFAEKMQNEFGGTPGKARHPGSGKATVNENNLYVQGKKFHEAYNEQHQRGMSDKEIADYFSELTGEKISINELKAKRSISSQNERIELQKRVQRLRDGKGYGWTQIGKMIGKPESSVRSLYEQSKSPKKQLNEQVADRLEEILKRKGGYLDISSGTELGYPWEDGTPRTGISASQMKVASLMLKEKGYEVHRIDIKQVTNPKQYTSTLVLAPKGTTKRDIIENLKDIHSMEDYSPDGGRTWFVPELPNYIDRSRVYVRFDEGGQDGKGPSGTPRDGLVEIRPGLKDLNLGDSAYSQVRIAVKNCDAENPNRYIKGMAVYSDEIPDGYDIVYNTSKPIAKGDEKGLKPIENALDVDAVFGAKIMAEGQDHWVDDKGVEHLGYVNKVNDEGKWQTWSKTLPSQFLAKQSEELIKSQLDLTYAEKMDEYNEIMSYSNPVVRQRALEEFASECDSSAVDLKATALPRQQSHVIIPINTLKDNECYAPGYQDGEEVVLIRFPHEGIFQIPRLIVNNKNKEGQKFIGPQAPDAIGITKASAEIMSGADFDGDTVLVIPTKNIHKINNRPPLEGLKDFDDKKEYPYREGMKILSKERTQTEMGIISNLITDMTIIGATDEELTRAVKHSMTIIDANKHKLDWQRSYIENGIAELHKKYQGKATGGAATLLSKATSEQWKNERTLAKVDEETGELKQAWRPNPDGTLTYMETGRTRRVLDKNKDGTPKLDENGKKIYKEVPVQEKIPRMALATDAHELSSGSVKEEIYADYANSLKALAIQARKEALNMTIPSKNPEAAAAYKNEVETLNAKLQNALRNAPKERQAQVLANVAMQEIFNNNPGMEKDQIKKEAQLQMTRARAKVGAHKQDVLIDITPKEWEAIQANAISPSKLRDILKNADSDKVKKLASPKPDNKNLPTAKQNRIKAMAATGYTLEEIAAALGIPKSTAYYYIKGKEA